MATIPPPLPIEEQVRHVHAELREEFPAIGRIAVAAYDPKTDLLKTFVSSNEGADPLPRYEARLAEIESLSELAKSGRDRVIHDLSKAGDSQTRHTRVIAERFQSSYTRPLRDAGRLRGFIFYDSIELGYFTPAVVQRLTVYSELMAVLLSQSLFPASMLRSAVKVASELSQSRDPETGAHLDRMSRYARLVALGVGDRLDLSSAFVEHLFAFAPLHDVGKVGIPDNILLKKGPLTDDEMAVMQTHTTRGADVIDRLLTSLSLGDLTQADMLRNIVLYHHERWDGGGYPAGLRGTQIPLEARIVTVADVFDALASARPYKPAWPVDRAFDYLVENSGKAFDPDCVQALVDRRGELETIKSTFPDEPGAVRLREGYLPDV